ncbi:hypothetical protein A1A1_16490 [Planococcus antarcticus DSM 14505]|uniref:DUF4306 domain-containing protein n=1 Tax=Planococcus antarcticus DSM 14505 TaxID=1185653 RepID=A0AA87LQB1_9BACL|nr:DUF4306 domain-containing protein [Planococcus antarcticus]EIM05381.1 hypothetical protein A1A1_16490 [Planococcus antarcticus DSM 14505]
MAFRNMVLFIGAFVLFIFATLVSWYEGGQLRYKSVEWEHTAFFSNWTNDGFTNSENLLTIDHFVYAAKFEPLFPLLMAASFLWMVFQVAFWIFKRHRVANNTFLLFMAMTSFVMCPILFNSPTTGFKLFSLFFALVGLGSILGMFLFEGRRKRMIEPT